MLIVDAVERMREVNYPNVNTFADLPEASKHENEIYIVKTATGVMFVNRKRAGLYLSDGSGWYRLGEIVLAGSGSPEPGYLPSNPPSGKCVVTNLFVDPDNGRLTVLYDDQGV